MYDFNSDQFMTSLNEIQKKAIPENLFFEGDLSLLENYTRVSVVGSRKVSDNGKIRAKIITEVLVDHGFVIVSGLAEGVDTVAHKTAIEKGGKTIAVLGTPLDKCSPVSNRDLLELIKREHLAVSQFKKGERVYSGNFPKRNKTMALLSDATIIIEASEKSGTRHQAWEALKMGRLVLILENVVKQNLEWVNKSLNYGAEILTRENLSQKLELLPLYEIH